MPRALRMLKTPKPQERQECWAPRTLSAKNAELQRRRYPADASDATGAKNTKNFENTKNAKKARMLVMSQSFQR